MSCGQAVGNCVIGLGGGSPIDTAKAVAALGIERRPIPSMKAPNVTDVPGLPVIAVPTTAGTRRCRCSISILACRARAITELRNPTICR
jgi:glycerol dehydrogenase-like iron-containing ADH family enzyme